MSREALRPANIFPFVTLLYYGRMGEAAAEFLRLVSCPTVPHRDCVSMLLNGLRETHMKMMGRINLSPQAEPVGEIVNIIARGVSTNVSKKHRLLPDIEFHLRAGGKDVSSLVVKSEGRS